jgi:hypothetical protein
LPESEEVQNAQQFAIALGEVKGQLGVMTQMIQETGAGTNRRIDDFRKSMQAQNEATNQRIDDHQKATDHRFESIENGAKSMRTKTYVGSGVVSTLVNVFAKALEIIGS